MVSGVEEEERSSANLILEPDGNESIECSARHISIWSTSSDVGRDRRASQHQLGKEAHFEIKGAGFKKISRHVAFQDKHKCGLMFRQVNWRLSTCFKPRRRHEVPLRD